MDLGRTGNIFVSGWMIYKISSLYNSLEVEDENFQKNC